MNYMKKKIVEIFNDNLEYVYYARSGIVYHTRNSEEIYYLKNKGWKYNKIDSVSPPTITICDICDCEKIMQYNNARFNLAYFLFIKKLKENNKLDNFIKNIINKKNIYYKDFHYHISDGPILENSVRIKGIDNRINTLKIDLVKEFIKDEQYQYYINQVKSMIKNNSNYELPLINDEQTQEIKEYYEWLDKINKSIDYDIKIQKNIFKIDTKELSNIKYDSILLIPNGCYKYIDVFVNHDNIEKIMFMEIHADNINRGNHVINQLELKNKKVLLIDSAFSGKTLQIAKKYIQEQGGVPIILGIYPKSRSILNMIDYALIMNKIYNVKGLKSEDEDMFIKLYLENLKESE